MWSDSYFATYVTDLITVVVIFVFKAKSSRFDCRNGFCHSQRRAVAQRNHSIDRFNNVTLQKDNIDRCAQVFVTQNAIRILRFFFVCRITDCKGSVSVLAAGIAGKCAVYTPNRLKATCAVIEARNHHQVCAGRRISRCSCTTDDTAHGVGMGGIRNRHVTNVGAIHIHLRSYIGITVNIICISKDTTHIDATGIQHRNGHAQVALVDAIQEYVITYAADTSNDTANASFHHRRFDRNGRFVDTIAENNIIGRRRSVEIADQTTHEHIPLSPLCGNRACYRAIYHVERRICLTDDATDAAIGFYGIHIYVFHPQV